jgi:hypothetical protein
LWWSRPSWPPAPLQGPTWCLHAAVVVGVDADVLLLGAEGELAAVQGLELVVRLQVGPAPHAAVDDVGQALPVGHLQAAIQWPAESGTTTGTMRTKHHGGHPYIDRITVCWITHEVQQRDFYTLKMQKKGRPSDPDRGFKGASTLSLKCIFLTLRYGTVAGLVLQKVF